MLQLVTVCETLSGKKQRAKRYGCTKGGYMDIQTLASLGIGLLAGLFGGLVGLGGGALMIPLMVSLLKTRQHQAHGTSLMAIVFTGLSGAVTYSLAKSVDFLAAALLAVTAIFTAHAGARFANALPEWKLKRAFGGFLMVIAVTLVFKSYLPVATGGSVPFAVKVIVLLITGVLTGFLSGMMGVGGGLIMVPVMVLLGGMTQHIAQGTSLLVMVPTGSVGAWTHWRLGNVERVLLPGLIVGVVIGTSAGGWLANTLQEDALRLIFALVMVGIGARFLTVASRP